MVVVMPVVVTVAVVVMMPVVVFFSVLIYEYLLYLVRVSTSSSCCRRFLDLLGTSFSLGYKCLLHLLLVVNLHESIKLRLHVGYHFGVLLVILQCLRLGASQLICEHSHLPLQSMTPLYCLGKMLSQLFRCPTIH